MSAYERCILSNQRGTAVTIDALGAAIREVRVPDRSGKFANIALCPDRLASRGDDSYAGATLAPCAGRIREGRLDIDGRAARLARNDGEHHLHGGGNLSFAPWQVEAHGSIPEGERCALSFFAPDGLDGYPGDRAFSVEYTLTRDDSLVVRFRAVTTRPTWVNLSNHAYWNLSGDFARAIGAHSLRIAAQGVYFNDSAHLPVAEHALADTPFDFRAPRPIAERLRAHAGDAQLAVARGYNHAYRLDRTAPAATLTDPQSGRTLRLHTDYPALVLYTGGFLHGGIALTSGTNAFPSCALALEAQELPLGCAPLLRPGEVRERFIRYEFGVEPSP